MSEKGSAHPLVVTKACPFCNLYASAGIGDAGYSTLLGILLMMSPPGIAGPLLMRRTLIAQHEN
jgi:hypothetical protein